jgi:hypothetical protein
MTKIIITDMKINAKLIRKTNVNRVGQNFRFITEPVIKKKKKKEHEKEE